MLYFDINNGISDLFINSWYITVIPMSFNENTRVKIPAILHLNRLGYKYLSLRNANIEGSTNIFTDIFIESISQINWWLDKDDVRRELEKIILDLDWEDLGQKFYDRLVSTSWIRLIDFKDFSNNTFNVVTELTCKNGDDEFRPDITVLINGMPLAFIEVKKPNNQEWVLAERNRINVRFQNKKYRKFINISQLLVFSNNMEYDSESIEPVQWAFYSTTSYSSANFNCFREEDTIDLTKLLVNEDDELENFILKDNNLQAIKHSPEFLTNKNPTNPTNRILTSLFSKERLSMLLRYGIAYVKWSKGIEKHIMRYPQFFATRAIEKKIESGIRKGIIWHTQWSGKTALAFYSTHYLTDYYQNQWIIPKFYFIVDRLDLMIQARREFVSRWLVVHTVNSRDELMRDFATKRAINNLTGEREITVVNIQKFKDDTDIFQSNDYDINIQRIYFLDEAHRSYDPNGSFLANLIESDRNAIIIALTGTPLIGKSEKWKLSKAIFGDYIHKYYYNSSIADWYTLKLIREWIENSYKLTLDEALKKVEVLKWDADKRIVYAHESFVEPMLDYIVEDFVRSRQRFWDETIWGMVVCDSSDQAKTMKEIFQNKYSHELSAALILHDVGTKDERKDEIEDFKEWKIDLLFVYNMLLTWFDAHRLKKLYLWRVVRDHNLLQTLTRVNRPYKSFRYGYVVDFADIKSEFDSTNKAYFEELQLELWDEMQTYSSLFASKEEIEEQIKDIKENLFHYELGNAEIFSQQVSQIEDKTVVLQIKKALENAKNLYNIIRLYGHYDLLEKIDFKKLGQLYNEVSRHLDLLNLKESLENDTNTNNLLNVALENVLFMFRKVSEEELVLADELKDMLKKTREALWWNFDQKDPEFIGLYEELKRLFDKKNLDEVTQDEMKNNIVALQQIYSKVSELNRRNNLLKVKYQNDPKYARLHKRILEIGTVSKRESDIFETLQGIKSEADEKVLINTNMLNNEWFFNGFMIKLVVENFQNFKLPLDPESAKYINNCVVKEYLNEFQSVWQ